MCVHACAPASDQTSKATFGMAAAAAAKGFVDTAAAVVVVVVVRVGTGLRKKEGHT